MAIPDVKIGGGSDTRKGFTSAVNSFCDMASGKTVASQDYLSMATEVFLDGGMNPTTYGILGYVYCEWNIAFPHLCLTFLMLIS